MQTLRDRLVAAAPQLSTERMNAMDDIPFSPPDIRQEDIDAVVDVLKSGWITTGPQTRRFEEGLATLSGTEGCLAVSSATAAMAACLRFLGIGEGDEVIVPGYTYTATASVVHHVGARAVIVDSAPGTLHLDAETVDAAITARTKAVIAVDLAGIPAPVTDILSLLEKRRLNFRASSATQEALGRIALVSDAAHSVGAHSAHGPVGSLADFTCYSFHAVKNLATAEGGAITWRSADSWDLAAGELYHVLRRGVLHGQTKDALEKSRRGAWEYDIVELGHKANMTDIQAALGVSQLGRLPQMLERRREILRTYQDTLETVGVTLLEHFRSGRSAAHLAMTFLPPELSPHRNKVIERLADRGISSNVHYKPLPLLTAYQELGWRPAGVPNAVAAYEREITLPLHTLLTDEQVERVAETYVQVVRDL